LLGSGGLLPVPSGGCTWITQRRPPFPRRTRTAPRARFEIGLGEVKHLADPKARTPQEHDQRPLAGHRRPVASCTHDGDDLLDRRWVRRIAQAVVARRARLVGSPASWPASGDGEPCRTRLIPSRPPLGGDRTFVAGILIALPTRQRTPWHVRVLSRVGHHDGAERAAQEPAPSAERTAGVKRSGTR
jgi:hypothetical protein